MRRPHTLLALSLGIVCVTGGSAVAELPPSPAPHVLYAQAEIVAVGRVTRVGRSTIRVRVEQVLKGEPSIAIEVGPIFDPTCCPRPEGMDEPFFAVGDRILVAARRGEAHWEFVDPMLWTTRLDESHGLGGHSLDLVRELLRIDALPDATTRRAAMVAHLRSTSEAFADAAAWFQRDELDAPEKSAPHVRGLVAALDAPHGDGRTAAARALRGLTPEKGFEPLSRLLRAAARSEAAAAAATLAYYDRADVVELLVATGHLAALGPSPRPEAQARIFDAVRSTDAWLRSQGYRALTARYRSRSPTKDELHMVIAIFRNPVRPQESHAMADALLAMPSSWTGAEMLAVVHDHGSDPAQRRVAYRVLWEHGVRGGRQDVVDLLRANEAALVARLDGGDDGMHLVRILVFLGTPAARDALVRAAARDAPGTLGDAARALREWDVATEGSPRVDSR